jgi:hypothetical protein
MRMDVTKSRRHEVTKGAGHRLFPFVPILLLCFAAGCMDEERPSARERQDEALRDPFKYGPQMPDVSGGSTSEFDRDAFRGDVDRVINP